MRKIIISLCMIAIFASASMMPAVRQSALDSFTELSQIKSGKSLVDSIKIQLIDISSNPEHIVDRIIDQLEDLLNDETNKLSEDEVSLSEAIAAKAQAAEDFQAQIDDKESELASHQAQLPIEQGILAQANIDLGVQTTLRDNAVDNLNSINEINVLAIAAHAVSIQKHNDVIDALKECREIVLQLKVKSYLQKNQNTLELLQEHNRKTMSLIQTHKLKGVYSLFMQMAQDVGILADQELVDALIEILDELIQSEYESITFEDDIEAGRIADFNDQVAIYTGIISDANAQISSLNSQIASLINSIANHEAQIAILTPFIAELHRLLEESNIFFSLRIQFLQQEIEQLHREIELIRQAIAIFQGEAIEDIRDVVAGVEF